MGRIVAAQDFPEAIYTSASNIPFFKVFGLNFQPRPGHQWTVESITAVIKSSGDPTLTYTLSLLFGPQNIVIGTFKPNGGTAPTGEPVTLNYASTFTADWSDTFSLQLTGPTIAAVQALDMLMTLRLMGTIA